ncbi:MAG TPA: hypothetical protein VE907_15140 [Gammaproteobacteria bacterium]|nr:hypothetical protein [Gammaproteobacteria bacterium]
MKYLFAMIVGLLLGAAAAGGVLYYNPLTESSGPEPAAADRALHYDLPAQVLGVSLGERALLPTLGSRDTALWEDTIDRTALLGLVLQDDANRPAAVASRLLAGSARTDLLLRGVVLSDYWLLTIPDEGTLFVRVDTNVWPFLKQTLLPVWFFDRPWQGPVEYRPTAGPGAQNTAIVIGATGRFSGVEGSAVERYRVTTLNRAANKAEGVGELHLHFFEPQVTAEQPTPGDG